jgi:hypothetical protein
LPHATSPVVACSRKYLIENLEGDKVVSRKKGITTKVCTAALPVSSETPEMQFLPAGEKARLAGNQQCRKAETTVRPLLILPFQSHGRALSVHIDVNIGCINDAI